MILDMEFGYSLDMGGFWGPGVGSTRGRRGLGHASGGRAPKPWLKELGGAVCPAVALGLSTPLFSESAERTPLGCPARAALVMGSYLPDDGSGSLRL